MEEKRTHIRINQLHLIHYECLDPQHHLTQQGMGRTLDISESGLQLELAGDFELDQEVKFTLGVGEDLVELTGRVVRHDPGKGTASHYGIQLFDIKGGGRDRLTHYIQRVRTAPADRRRQVRIDMRYLLGYEFHDSEDEVDRSGIGRTLNLSVEGIVFEAFHSVEIGQEVALTLALDENSLAELKGEVMHLRKVADKRYRVGIKFTTIHPTVQRILGYLINKQRRSDAGSV
jgi:c-di-GMP-binding flagellar brake protein YcgR